MFLVLLPFPASGNIDTYHPSGERLSSLAVCETKVSMLECFLDLLLLFGKFIIRTICGFSKNWQVYFLKPCFFRRTLSMYVRAHEEAFVNKTTELELHVSCQNLCFRSAVLIMLFFASF